MERIVETIKLNGQVLEYSMLGEGEPVLVMHGGHSSCNEELGYANLIKNGYSIITPSRAGYGRTSRAIGESLTKACKYYVQLLDQLNLKKVHLLAVSAGGPSGIIFASNYPKRVKTLTLQSAVMKQWHTPKDMEYKVAHVLFKPPFEKITWKLVSAMSNKFPNYMFKQFVPSFSTLSNKKVTERICKTDLDVFNRMTSRQRSGHGFLIDLAQTDKLSTDDLESISCPTLIMHSKNDAAVPVEHAHYADKHIPNSELCILDSWGHLIWIGEHAKEFDTKLNHFLQAHTEKCIRITRLTYFGLPLVAVPPSNRFSP
ncbi:alpha/beta fold hydrolase [Alkalihalobacillus sp. AL-G]|uniref:alpha/beta fold hydrolase n=1 Tax=Alkalihalobacillus sp. AL-G TaxID=2926399 RepID=UPI00272B50BA|nr:alpha/beta hydrolase [Alkalihalobacillus sp. AL-G]WLD94421.1 alpha/beta hydrolase [Alkalihalobacillus sp. AL-G]